MKLFNLIKAYRDRKLRERCIKYALQVSNNKNHDLDIEVNAEQIIAYANGIFEFISTGVICEWVYKHEITEA